MAMSLSIISFTSNGLQLSEKLGESLDWEDISLYTKWSGYGVKIAISSVQYVKEQIGEWTREQMCEKNAVLFIGACGIAVRAIAPCITDKLQDSPVLVIDEKGEYIIPILSGHAGGANEMAVQISQKIGAIPVITTATDKNGKFAVDLFAKKNGFHIVNREGIAKVSSKVLNGTEITMSVEQEHIGANEKIPKGIKIVPYPPDQPIDVVITTEAKEFQTLLHLKPREYVIGMGCKRGKETEKIKEFIRKTLQELDLKTEQIYALASIDKKKDEKGLLTWSRKEGIPFLTFSAKQLQEAEGDFHSSAFVEEQVGVDNVCERAALNACGTDGTLICRKHIEDGMTIAIAKRKWSVLFDEE